MTQAPLANPDRASDVSKSSPAVFPDFQSGGAMGANPSLTENDVISGLMGQGPDYKYNPNGVPIGAGLSFTAKPMGTGSIHIATAKWTGGTLFSDYFGDPANAAPAPSMIVGKAATDGESYSFLVDSKPRTYTVSVVVTYADNGGNLVPGGPFSASVTFTSYGPKATMAYVKPQGMPKFFPTGNINNNGTFVPASVIAYGSGPDVGMRFQATVTASPNFGGEFMFAQIITPQRTLAAAKGGVINFSGNGQMNYDDGTFGTYGFPQDDAQGNTGQGPKSWTEPDNFIGNDQHSMSDSPYIYATSANDPLQLSVGTANNATPPVLTSSEKFSTYLMYKNSIEGVWVALAEMDWSWSLGETRKDVNSPWTESVPLTSPQPTAAAPPEIGPVWTIRFSNGKYA